MTVLKKCGELMNALNLLQAARLCDPRQFHLLKEHLGDAEKIRELLASMTYIPNIRDGDIDVLIKELPVYLQSCEADPAKDYDDEEGKDVALQEWWLKNEVKQKIGAWANTYDKCLLLVPSSCAAERVFSMLEATFDKNQAGALNDYRELSMMLQYNSAKAKRNR